MYAPESGTMAFVCAFFCCCIGNAFNRNKVREFLGLSGNCFVDCLGYWCFCYYCMATQEYRELASSGKCGASNPVFAPGSEQGYDYGRKI